MNDPEHVLPKTVSPDEWHEVRKALQKEEQNLARKREHIISERRKLPMVQMSKDHVFEGPEGKVGLIDLFDGCRQLFVYHFWFEQGEEPCEGCSLWTRDLGDLGGDFASLRKHDASIAFVSRASVAEIEAVKKTRRWTMPWYSVTGEDFYEDTDYAGWAQIAVFVRNEQSIYLPDIIPDCDLVTIGNHWTLLDYGPFGLKDV